MSTNLNISSHFGAFTPISVHPSVPGDDLGWVARQNLTLFWKWLGLKRGATATRAIWYGEPGIYSAVLAIRASARGC